MFELLGRVDAALGDVPHALIGAGAMSVAGFARATLDLDLLVLDPRVLDGAFWASFTDCEVERNDGRSDPTDPLLGLVRIEDEQGSQVDLVIGRHPKWQQPILTRARPVRLDEVAIPVATVPDLILLKLFAGAPNDQNDILELLRLEPTSAADVDARVNALPRNARDLWVRLRTPST